MSFLETPRFPDTIAFGAVGGPGFSTGVVTFASGYESRNANWSASRHAYEVSQAVRSKSDMDDLIAFFRVAQGRANGFRFRDFADYSAASGEGVLTELTANTTWQLYKRYTSGASTSDRIITKPISSTIAFTGGGSYTLDATTGIVTRNSGSNPTGWSGEFDVPCRFDIDQMQHEIVSRSPQGEVLIAWRSIPLVEIRV